MDYDQSLYKTFSYSTETQIDINFLNTLNLY